MNSGEENPSGQHARVVLAYVPDTGPVLNIDLDAPTFGVLSRQLGNSYKARRWVEARTAEVEGLSADTVRHYLHFMLGVTLNGAAAVDNRVSVTPVPDSQSAVLSSKNLQA